LLLKKIKIKMHITLILLSYFMWVRNLVSQTKGRTKVEGIQEQGAAEKIWACEKLGVTGGCRKLHTVLSFTLLTKYYLGDQIKNNEMERACGTNGEEEMCTQCF
jgi:hypothetical protein